MASKHLNHKDFKKNDILNTTSKSINEENLNRLCSQINELSCWDKVGSEFYKIDNSSTNDTPNRNFDFISQWLDHLETLPSTSKNVGYLGNI